jgi:hypothetical protein
VWKFVFSYFLLLPSKAVAVTMLANSPFRLARAVSCISSAVYFWPNVYMNITVGLHALSNKSRLQILGWLKDATGSFPAQVDGDLVKDGVCGLLNRQETGCKPAHSKRTPADTFTSQAAGR